MPGAQRLSLSLQRQLSRPSLSLQRKISLSLQRQLCTCHARRAKACSNRDRIFIDNPLFRIHFIIEMILGDRSCARKFKFPFPGSIISTFLQQVHSIFITPAQPCRVKPEVTFVKQYFWVHIVRIKSFKTSNPEEKASRSTYQDDLNPIPLPQQLLWYLDHKKPLPRRSLQ